MNITLTDDDGNQVNVTVAPDNWVSASIDAAWAWLNHRGAESVTAREAGGENAGARIATVSLTLHDE